MPRNRLKVLYARRSLWNSKLADNFDWHSKRFVCKQLKKIQSEIDKEIKKKAKN